jgi:uncharacterized protein YigA (DUF484 family)
MEAMMANPALDLLRKRLGDGERELADIDAEIAANQKEFQRISERQRELVRRKSCLQGETHAYQCAIRDVEGSFYFRGMRR